MIFRNNRKKRACFAGAIFFCVFPCPAFARVCPIGCADRLSRRTTFPGFVFLFLLARLRLDVCGVLVVLLGSVLFVRSVTTLRNALARAQVVTLCYPL